jgi:hypothetical protein
MGRSSFVGLPAVGQDEATYKIAALGRPLGVLWISHSGKFICTRVTVDTLDRCVVGIQQCDIRVVRLAVCGTKAIMSIYSTCSQRKSLVAISAWFWSVAMSICNKFQS